MYKYDEGDVFFCNDIIETEDELIKIILIILYLLFGKLLFLFLQTFIQELLTPV